MRTLANLITSIILAAWILAIAILSVQNATPVSLRFLNFQSIELPVGLMLAFWVGVGIVGMSLALPLWSLASSRQGYSQSEDVSSHKR